jgi:hypothetical protein
MKYYTRVIDAGFARHDVTVENNTIIDSSFVCMNGGTFQNEKAVHAEYIGSNKLFLRGKGFKKVVGPSCYNTITKKWSNKKDESDTQPQDNSYEYPGEVYEEEDE